MTRNDAAKLLRKELDLYNLNDWSIQINALSLDSRHQFLGMCSYKDKCIILNAHHIDIHPDLDIIDTIKHEVAHALTMGHEHDEIWAAKAKELGCTSTAPCSTLTLPSNIIDAIRSGATVEVTFDEEIIRRPKYLITRLQDRCPDCNKVAVTKNELLIDSNDDMKPDTKMIFLECGHVIQKSIPKATPFHKLISNGHEEYVKTCAHEWNKNQCMICREYKPFDFQIEGMKFLESAITTNSGGICADEMGLGKTVQALGVVKFHPELWPVLYIVKSGIKFQWFKEILRWCGDEFVGQIISSSNDFIIPNLKTYIISYDILVPKIRKIKGKTVSQGFDISKLDFIKTIVMDECQQIKNPDSTRTQQVRKIAKGKSIIPLSGTIWKNRFSEYFPSLNMVAPMKFSSHQGFKDRWVKYYWDGKYSKEGGCSDIKGFKEYTKDIVIRRERTEVLKELPLVNRMKLHVQLDQFNQNEYDEEVSDFVSWYNKAVIGGEEDQLSGMNMLAKLSRMRHITGLAKIPATEEFIDNFFEETDRKLVIFVHHKDVGSILYDNLKRKYENQFPILKLTAEMSSEERFKTQESFNNSPRALMIGSTLASGEGLNLQSCADCVMHERQWNPANEEQAEGRFIRIGQTATSVNSTYVESEDTIDSMFDSIVESKRIAFHEAMNKGIAPTWNQGDLIKELASKIVANHNKKNRKKSQTNIMDKVKVS